MKKIITSICLLSLFFIGCEKEELEGDTAFLIGKWRWVYTVKTGWGHLTGTTYDTIYPTESFFYELEFDNTAKFTINYSGKKESYRIISIDKDYGFLLYLDKKNDNNVRVVKLSEDNVTVDIIPYHAYFQYRNYYTKVK